MQRKRVVSKMKTKISTIRRWLACMLCAVMVTVSLSGCENMGKIGNIVSGVTAAGEFPAVERRVGFC